MTRRSPVAGGSLHGDGHVLVVHGDDPSGDLLGGGEVTPFRVDDVGVPAEQAQCPAGPARLRRQTRPRSQSVSGRPCAVGTAARAPWPASAAMSCWAAADRSNHSATTAQASPCRPNPTLAEVTSSKARSASANTTPAMQPSSGIHTSSTGVARQITTHQAKPWSGPHSDGACGVQRIVSPTAAATRAAAHPAVSAPLATQGGTNAPDHRAAAAEVKGEANGNTMRAPRSTRRWRARP